MTTIPQATIDELRRRIKATQDPYPSCVNRDDLLALLSAAERCIHLEAVLRRLRERAYKQINDDLVEEIDEALKEQP